jgi:hypothetical protein
MVICVFVYFHTGVTNHSLTQLQEGYLARGDELLASELQKSHITQPPKRLMESLPRVTPDCNHCQVFTFVSSL